MKKILCILLSIWMVLAFVGCDPNNGNDIDTSSDTESDTETESDSESEVVDLDSKDYSVVQIEGDYYIEFEDPSKYTQVYGMLDAGVSFSSVDEFYHTVTEGSLSSYAKAILVNVHLKEDTRVKICNLDSLYIPVLPENASVSGFYWTAELYSFFVDLGEEASANVLYLSEEYFNLRCPKESEISYVLQEGSKTVRVCEKLDADGNPARIELYCSDGELFYQVSLSGLAEKPTENWLLSFGLTPYVAEPME